MPREVAIIDTTLREGEQTPGVLFSLDEKKRIIDGLAGIGVQEVELGIASRYQSCLGSLVDYCRTSQPRLKLSIWSRCLEEDIAIAAVLRPDCLALSIPVSDIHLHKRLGKDRTWALSTMRSAIASARQKGMAVAIGFEDATRSEERFLGADGPRGGTAGRCAHSPGRYAWHRLAWRYHPDACQPRKKVYSKPFCGAYPQ